MSYEYYTIVKASEGFWEKLLMKQINKEKPLEINKIVADEIVINSTNKTPLDDIIKLSKEYPEEVFRVKIAGEDVYENYVYLYECSKGDSKLVKEGLEYCFGIKTEDRDKLEKGLFNRFQKRVADYYQRIEQSHLNEVKLELNFDEDQKEEEDEKVNISVIIEYKTGNVCLTAKKFGLTYISVAVEFLDKPDNFKSSERESPSDYDDVPF
jgi:hypothetical protein